jgi:hypothetical protein
MNPLILALLLAAPAPSRDQILAARVRAQSNRREKALAERLNNPRQSRVQRTKPPEAPQRPGATETLLIPVTGNAIDSTGRTFTFSGTITLSIETPSPTPVPIVTKLSAILDPLTALPVTSGAVGERLLLTGQRLQGGDLIRVTVAGETAVIARQSAESIEFTVPAVPAGRSPVLALYWLISNGWQLKGTLPFTVRGSTPPPPPPPPPPGPADVKIDGLRDWATAQPATGGKVGQRMVLEGRFFPYEGVAQIKIGGQMVGGLAQSVGMIGFQVPDAPVGAKTLELWWFTESEFKLMGSLPFTVR